ncbi:alpha/beta hydrolase [Methylobacterium sp. J-026]|uniref:alpha/beta hydrolase n=1 Tax=Methylobacterium sp. J-026 TaxID=2836624 RepID=UPI001FBA8F1D|nr:alpha/beta hydrolase [Methylobacterium sp. J-026]
MMPGKFTLSLLAVNLLGVPAFAQTGPARQALVAGERVINLPLGGGVDQRVLYDAPPHPRATLVMLPGGSGDIGVRRDGDLRHEDNFVVRTRADWVARGYAVLIPDTVDQANLRGLRSSPAYGQLVNGLAAYARDRASAPVFLVGTSQGTIAAINGAAHARSGLIAGLVLTESVSVPGQRSTETVFDADPGGVRVPVLVVANRDDACDVAPPEMAPRIAATMTRSPSVRVLAVSGGMQRSDRACGSLSPHGYYGIEQEVVGGIAGWLQTHGG